MYRRYVLSVLVENRSGVLSRISGLITRRGFNIDSLTVAETENPAISRMTIVLHCDESVVEQMKKQLEKQVDVKEVAELVAFLASEDAMYINGADVLIDGGILSLVSG